MISDRDSNAIEGNDEDDEQDPPIDPVMLKYMEMIKQRREADNKVVYCLNTKYQNTKEITTVAVDLYLIKC